MRNTIWGVMYGDCLIRHMSDARRVVDPGWDSYLNLMAEMWRRSGLMRDAQTTAEEMAAAMERYNLEVQETVPAERLLVWSAVEGWEPICEFLGLPIPDAEFPRVNDSARFEDLMIDGAIDAIQRHRSACVAAVEAS
jgi:hypothetical protein